MEEIGAYQLALSIAKSKLHGVMEELAAIVHDQEAPASDRIRAAELIFDELPELEELARGERVDEMFQ